MVNDQHISKTDLESLLFGDQDEVTSEKIEEHVSACKSCQRSLDELAANNDIWQKLGTMLDDRHLTETAEFRTPTPEMNELENDAHEDIRFHYPLDSLFDPPSHPEMLGRIGKYDVEREIGRGGMGIVVKAHDSELNRPLAIKLLAPHLATIGTARKRFAREARAAAAVLHPNVIAIHGVNSECKTPYIVMPYIVGPSIQSWVDEQGPLDEKDIVRIALQIASGMAAAHSQGIVHRDIKPANILIEQNVCRVVITDFGLARAADDASMTQTGFLAGTPNFMSPEQTSGKTIDHRSDLFSLGSVLYFMATGRLPFRAETPIAVLNRIVNETPTPVRQVNPDISKTMANIIGRLLAKAPSDRYRSAADLHEILEQYLRHLQQPDFVPLPKTKKNRRGKIQNKNLSSSGIQSNGFQKAAMLIGMFVIPFVIVYSLFWFDILPFSTDPANTNPSANTNSSGTDSTQTVITGAESPSATSPLSKAKLTELEASRYDNYAAEFQATIERFKIEPTDIQHEISNLSQTINSTYSIFDQLGTVAEVAELESDYDRSLIELSAAIQQLDHEFKEWETPSNIPESDHQSPQH